MKNITLSADEQLIERARQTAQAQRTTLNAVFREWLEQYVSQNDILLSYDEVKRQLAHVRSGRKYTRDEMNERR